MPESKLQIRGVIEDNSNTCIFLFLIKNICCDPSLELSHQDSSNDGSQHMFERSNIENYPLIIPFSLSYLEHC